MLPAHKNLKHPAGQVTTPKCAAAAIGGCYCDGSCMREKDIVKERTLKDYIHRKQESDSFFKD